MQEIAIGMCLLFAMVATHAMPGWSIHSLTSVQKQRMGGVTWHQGCPVALADLRDLSVPYWGSDTHYHTGHLIVHKKVVKDLTAIMVALAKKHFTIARMVPICHYGGDDARSMADNNTSAFNCRLMTGSSSKFSVHSYGKAVDLNPLWNPYVKGDTVLPKQGKAYNNRSQQHIGMIRAQDDVCRLFTEKGWLWGGGWQSLKDYQHFELASNDTG